MINYYEQLEDTPNSPKGTIWQTGLMSISSNNIKVVNGHSLYAKTGIKSTDQNIMIAIYQYKQIDMKRWFKRINKQQMLEHFKNKKNE